VVCLCCQRTQYARRDVGPSFSLELASTYIDDRILPNFVQPVSRCLAKGDNFVFSGVNNREDCIVSKDGPFHSLSSTSHVDGDLQCTRC
jgi:hypothetical protein